MDRIAIIGDSNLYRNATADRLAGRLKRPITMMNTTRLVTLESNLKDLAKSDCKLILISAFANILSDFGRGLEANEVLEAMTKGLKDCIDMVKGNLSSDKKVLIMPPLFRSEPKWFGDHLPSLQKSLSDQVLAVENLVLLPEFKINGTDLIEDGVHLLPETGIGFVNHLVSCLLDLEPMPSSSARTSGAGPPGLLFQANPNPTVTDVVSVLNSSLVPDLNQLKKQVGALQERFGRRTEQDDIIFATHEEKLDHAQNTRTGDRAIVMGLKADKYPSDIPSRKTYITEAMKPLVHAILGEVEFEVFPKNEQSDNELVPPFEMKFTDVKLATKFKREAYQKILSDDFREAFTGVSVYPKVTLGTRVRMEILRAIAKKLTSKEESGYCPIHNQRPILHVGPVVDGRVVKSKTYLFVEAVMRYRHLLSVPDLSFAYSRVGTSFPNGLRQLFLVLEDEDRTIQASFRSMIPQPVSSGRGRGTKRKGSGSSSGQSRNQKGGSAKCGK